MCGAFWLDTPGVFDHNAPHKVVHNAATMAAVHRQGRSDDARIASAATMLPMSAEYPMPWTFRSSEVGVDSPTRGVLRGTGFVHLRRGVWAPPGIEPLNADVRISAVAAALPEHAVIGGWSAARLHERAAASDGIELFDGSLEWEDPRGPGPIRGDAARVVVCAPRDSRLVLRPDVRVFRTPVPPGDRDRLSGITVTNGDRTAFDLARLLPSTPAVLALDRLLHLGAATRPGIGLVASSSPRWRGLVRARRALALADGGSESPQETILRLLWTGAGLPRPRCNNVVRDAFGRFVARVDLVDPEAGVVGEYDGAMHADAARRSDDARRQEDLEALGLVLVRATAVDVLPDGAEAWQRRLRAGYGRAAQRPSGRRRWRVTER